MLLFRFSYYFDWAQGLFPSLQARSSANLVPTPVEIKGPSSPIPIHSKTKQQHSPLPSAAFTQGPASLLLVRPGNDPRGPSPACPAPVAYLPRSRGSTVCFFSSHTITQLCEPHLHGYIRPRPISVSFYQRSNGAPGLFPTRPILGNSCSSNTSLLWTDHSCDHAPTRPAITRPTAPAPSSLIRPATAPKSHANQSLQLSHVCCCQVISIKPSTSLLPKITRPITSSPATAALLPSMKDHACSLPICTSYGQQRHIAPRPSWFPAASQTLAAPLEFRPAAICCPYFQLQRPFLARLRRSRNLWPSNHVETSCLHQPCIGGP